MQLSIKVCKWLDWKSPNGQLKEMSCRVALLRLDEKGLIKLPEAKIKPPKRSHGIGNSIGFVNQPSELECDLNKLQPIKIIKVQSSDNERSRIWDELMARYHYLGCGPLCGAQIRYLIQSESQGYVGGMAFSAAAWQLAARDLWIGWDATSRSKHLNEVICNSRFLILPHIKVKNLASHVLSVCVKSLCEDWYEQYKIRPVLLETFIEQEKFEGTCYRAANWIHVGQTKGRGRQDQFNRYAKSIKDIYVYPVQRDYQAVLCDGAPLPMVTPPKPADWAEEEFGTADLNDRRRFLRLLMIARDFYAKPQANIPQACGSRAKTKAAYRFFKEPEITMEKILNPHYQKTIERVKAEKTVLAIQDTTILNYTAHPATENLGPINREKDSLIGLFVHDTMAFNLDGMPLGLLNVQCWARDPAETGKKRKRHKVPIEEKESKKWLDSYKVQGEIQKLCRDTQIVNISDRESDIYEFFDLARNEPDSPKLLVRAKSNRVIAEEQRKLWDYLSHQDVSGIQYVRVPRKKGVPSREACLKIHFAHVKLNPPHNKRKFKPLTIWAILAEETEPPNGAEALKWLLLTTCEVNTFEEAVEKLSWYCIRWQIEIYHRTLKSGCKVEERQFGDADTIESCLAIDMVVAWRIFYLTKLGREIPDVPCTVFFEDAEWKALVAYKTQNAIPPEKPPTLREALRMVASLGGFLGRKCDGEPGTKSLWLGIQRLDDLTGMWKILMAGFSP
jgi:hypothetical protein